MILLSYPVNGPVVEKLMGEMREGGFHVSVAF